ncbi:hypothetical protein I4200191B4_30210 [Pseudoflavonifractor gallinarum]
MKTTGQGNGLGKTHISGGRKRGCTAAVEQAKFTGRAYTFGVPRIGRYICELSAGIGNGTFKIGQASLRGQCGCGEKRETQGTGEYGCPNG